MKPLAPLLPVETSSWSAQAFAIVQQREAVRKLEAAFDEEVLRSSQWKENDDAMSLALGLNDDVPTKVEAP